MTAPGALAPGISLAISLGIYGMVTVVLGRLALALFPGSERELLRGWAPALLAGQLVLGTAALVTGFLPLSMPAVGGALLVVAAGFGMRRLARLRSRSGSPWGSELRWSLLTAGALVLLYPNVLYWILRRPVVDWDARSIWFFHARVLFVDGGLDPSVFTDPVYLHSAYPLLLPIQGAWLAFLQGGWDDVTAKSFLLLDFAARLQLLWKLLRARGFPAWAGLAATVLFLDAGVRTYSNGFGYAHVNGYADAHYIAPLLLALLAFSLPRREGGPALGVLLLAFAANVKLESGLYVLLLAGAAALVTIARALARRSRRATDSKCPERKIGRNPFPSPREVVAGLTLGGAPLALWGLFRAIHGIRSYMNPSRWLFEPGAAVALMGERAAEIASYFGGFFLDSGGVWLVAVWLGLVAVRALRARHDGRRTVGVGGMELVAVALVPAVAAVIFVMYALTPLELDVHLRTSADRLLSLPLALLYGAVLLAVGSFFRTETERGTHLREHPIGPPPDSPPQLGGVSSGDAPPSTGTSLIRAKRFPSVSWKKASHSS